MAILISEHFTYKKLFKFVLPSVLMMAVTSAYCVIDGLFISNFVGKTAFASINLIMPLTMILGGVGYMLGTGGTALVSKLMGEGENEKAKKIFTMIIAFTVIFGVVLSATGIAVTRPVARLFGATESMMEYCVTYGVITIGFVTFLMLQNVFQSFLAAAGKPMLGFIVTLIAGCANVVLDALFIVGLRWGVVGAAVATGIGQVSGSVIPLIYFACKNGSTLKFTKTGLQIKPLLKACANGSSELLTNIAASVVSILYNLQLLKYIGENGVSAYGVLMYLQFIIIAILLGYTVGSAPIVAYNYGAENHVELKNIFRKSMIILGIAGVVLSGLAQALAVPLGKLFVGYDEELLNLTVHAFRLFSFTFVFSGINVFSSGFFTALNNGLVSAILSVLRSMVFQIAFVFLLPFLFNVDGIWWAMFATEVGAFVVAVSFFIAMRKKYNYA